jgi:signal transduction histidine kinase
MLAERGLAPAIDALAARSPVPARATVEVRGRAPANVETAAWFVVSEALANTAKHSGARRATVWVTMRNGNLHIEVVDDGRGGADANGAGLHGLAQRVEALDGTLEVNSPPGGPTVVRAVLPCG